MLAVAASAMIARHSSAGGPSNGASGSPVRSTLAASPRWAATSTSCPARCAARASGTSGIRCPELPRVTNSTRTPAPLAAAEARRPLLAERRRALGEVLGARAQLLHRHLELERRGERGARRRVEHALGQPDRDGRAGQQLVDQRLGGRLELLERRDAVGEPDPLRLLAADQLAGEDELLGAAEADDLG